MVGIRKGGDVEANGGKVQMAGACCLDLYHVPNSGYPDIRQSPKTAGDNFLSLIFANTFNLLRAVEFLQPVHGK